MTGLPSINLVTARGTMARRRNGAGHSPLWLAVAALIITLILLASIKIAGEVTTLREDIQTLGRRCNEQSSRGALLALNWNTESSRQVVMRRAQRELKLVCPDEPALMLVTAPSAEADATDGLLALNLSTYGVPAARAGEQP